MIKKAIIATLVAGCSIFGAPSAEAVPWQPAEQAAERGPAPLTPWPGGDPHIPNPPAWCWKGFGNYFCDGQPYEDGSFWHAVPQPFFGRWDISCRKPSPNPLIVDPAPGGCGGEG